MNLIKFWGKSFEMDEKLSENLDRIKKAVKDDWDFILIFDGPEGSGKSTLAQQCAAKVYPKLSVDDICFTPEEFERRVREAKKYQAVVYDEAITGMYSRESMGAINIILNKMLAQIRQNNLFIFIVLPSFFDLDKYVAVWRSRALVHVATKGFQRGYFGFFGPTKKKILYLKGKQLYKYCVVPGFAGRFTDYLPLGKDYKKKKRHSLIDVKSGVKLDPKAIEKRVKEMYSRRYDKLNLKLKAGISNLNKNPNLTQKSLAEAFNLSARRVREITTEYEKIKEEGRT